MAIEYKLSMSQPIGEHPDLRNIRQWLLNPKYIKDVETFVDQNYQNPKVLDTFISAVANNCATYSDQQSKITAYQAFGTIINSLLEKYFKVMPDFQAVKMGIAIYFKCLLGWDMTYPIKKCMFRSFTAFLAMNEKAIGKFFEDVWEALTSMIDETIEHKINSDNEMYETIFLNGIEFTIAIPFNTSLQEIYHTVILIGEAIFENIQQKSEESQIRLVQNIKIIHQILFKEENIEKYYDVFKQIFRFWQNFNMEGLDMKKSLTPTYSHISNWDSFTEDLELVLNFKAVRDGANYCFNYFLLSENWQNTNLLELKGCALNIFNETLIIEDSILSCHVMDIPISNNIHFITQSVISSLKFLLANKNIELTEDMIELQMHMMETLRIYIEFNGEYQDTIADIIYNVVVPFLMSELRQLEGSYKKREDWRELLSILNDCCDHQQSGELISIACKIIEQAQQCEAVRRNLRLNALFTLAENLEFGQSLDQSYQPQYKLNLNISNSFLLITLLHFKKPQLQMEQSVMKELLSPDSFQKLSQWDKRFCFHYISSIGHILNFNHPEILDFYLKYCLNHPQIKSDPFYYDVVVSLCPDNCTAATARIFYQSIFKDDNSCNQKWQILSIIIKKYLDVLTEEEAVTMVELLQQDILRRLKYVVNKVKKSEKYEQTPLVPLHILSQISQDFDFIKFKPCLIKTMYSSLELISELTKVAMEDPLIRIAANLLEVTQTIPQNFEKILVDIKDAYLNNEYSGPNYYQFYGQAIEVLSKYINDGHNQQDKDKIFAFGQMVFNALNEGFAYMVHYPDQITSDQYCSISSHQILFIKLLILLGDTLPQAFIEEIKELCIHLLRLISGTAEYFLKSRSHNLRLICEFLTTKNYSLQGMYEMARSSNYSSNNDIMFFIYLASKIRAQLTKDQQFFLVLIILYLIKSNLAFKNCHIAIRERLIKQNSIFNYVALPFEACQSSTMQANQFFASFEEEDPSEKANILEALNGQMYFELRPIIDSIFRRNYTEDDKQTFENNFDEDLDQCDDSEEDEAVCKRKIYKISEKKNEIHQGDFVRQSIIAVKRQRNYSMIEEGNNCDQRRKKLKIEEFEPEKSRKEILMEKKKNRKNQRL